MINNYNKISNTINLGKQEYEVEQGNIYVKINFK